MINLNKASGGLSYSIALTQQGVVVDYRKLGRSHARKVLKIFTDNFIEIKNRCGGDLAYHNDPAQYIECLKSEAYDIFHDMIFNESIKQDGFKLPDNVKDEAEYNESALELISRSIDRTFGGSRNLAKFKGVSAITDPEEAYQTGYDLMSEVIFEAGKTLKPEDFDSNAEEILKEKAWSMLETKMVEETGVPNIHQAIRSFYERGMQRALDEVASVVKSASIRINANKVLYIETYQ